MRRVSSQLTIDAPREQVWEVLADLEAVQDYNPGVKTARLVSDASGGLGAGRHCDLAPGGYLVEQVTDWAQGHSYTLAVVDSNLPLAGATAQFFLEDAGRRTLASVHFDYDVKYGRLGRLLDRLMVSKQLDRAVPAILGGLKRYVEERQPSTAAA